MRASIDYISSVWCALFHSDVMWPIHGHYVCRQCLRQFPIPWEPQRRASEPKSILTGQFASRFLLRLPRSQSGLKRELDAITEGASAMVLFDPATQTLITGQGDSRMME